MIFSADLREILGHSVKHRGRSIPDPWLLAKCAYSTSKVASEILVGSLLGGNDLKYVAHKGCVRRASADGKNQQEIAEKAVLSRRKELTDGAGLNRLQRATEKGEWLTAIPHHLSGVELSR